MENNELIEKLNPFYGDVLPWHKPPEPLESLTSYLMRIAENNGIRTISELTHLLFPYHNQRNVRTLSDFPALSINTLAISLDKTKDEILATTFYHVARKFGRATDAQTVSRFLSGCIAQHLRFCPVCLQDKMYYRLSWRFSEIQVCHEHGVNLVECCSKCGKVIPLFPPSLKVGICPTCGFELIMADTKPLDEITLSRAILISNSINYFIVESDWEMQAKDVVRNIGYVLTDLRQSKNLTRQEIEKLLGLSEVTMKSLEYSLQQTGASFRNYIRLC